jgi:hypothetical protein
MPRVDNDIFYTKALKRYGYSAKGLNWNSTKTQQVRFEVIYSLIKSELAKATIIDAGCGFGDLYHFLSQKGVVAQRYIGYEAIAEFASYAKASTNQTIVQKDILKDPLEKADIYIASGSLNILKPFEAAQFLHNCFAHSKVGFVFNFLEGEDKDGSFNYMDIDFVLKQFDANSKVVIKRGYLDYDTTIYVKR